jgi:Chlorophyll A-B binding protein
MVTPDISSVVCDKLRRPMSHFLEGGRTPLFLEAISFDNQRRFLVGAGEIVVVGPHHHSLIVVAIYSIMVKLVISLLTAFVASAAAFAPALKAKSATQLNAEVWDPMGFYELGSGKAFDTFPGVFPDKQYLQASEIKQGRMAMLAWTGVWATTKVCG